MLTNISHHIIVILSIYAATNSSAKWTDHITTAELARTTTSGSGWLDDDRTRDRSSNSERQVNAQCYTHSTKQRVTLNI